MIKSEGGSANVGFRSIKNFQADPIFGSVSAYDIKPATRFDVVGSANFTVESRASFYALVFRDTSENRVNVGNAIDSGRVRNLYRAIDAMRGLDQDEPLHITDEAANNAQYALSLFIAHDLPPPSVFPNGADALVFKWDSGNGDKFAYLDEEILTFKIYAPISPVPLTLEIPIQQAKEDEEVFGLLGPISRSQITLVR